MSIHEKLSLLLPKRRPYTLVIHGGAGTLSKEHSTPEQHAAYKSALSQALLAGYQVLQDNGNALDAVTATVTILEGLMTSLCLMPVKVQSLMLPGKTNSSLALLTRTKNPCRFVRSLYLCPSLAPHAFLSGTTAESMGVEMGEILVDPSYFFTEKRWREHRRGLELPEEPLPYEDDHCDPYISTASYPSPIGTVGAVALDQDGCIAVLTSTGGRTNKLVGRIGDTPHMGAGFWAEEWIPEVSVLKRFWNMVTKRKEETYAVGISGTGDGDYFIRQSTAITIAHRIRYKAESLNKAAAATIQDLRTLGGLGGVIALDNKGNVTMPLNCSGMYRGVIREDGLPKTAIFYDEEIY